MLIISAQNLVTFIYHWTFFLYTLFWLCSCSEEVTFCYEIQSWKRTLDFYTLDYTLDLRSQSNLNRRCTADANYNTRLLSTKFHIWWIAKCAKNISTKYSKILCGQRKRVNAILFYYLGNLFQILFVSKTTNPPPPPQKKIMKETSDTQI
jgi:hypothetical protein